MPSVSTVEGAKRSRWRAAHRDIDRAARRTRCASRRLPSHRPGQRARRLPPPPHPSPLGDHVRRDLVVDRRCLDRRFGRLPLGARTHPRFRGVQGRRHETRSIMGGLALQAIIVALIAAAVGATLSFVLAPNFPLPVEIPASALWMLPVIGSRSVWRPASRGCGARLRSTPHSPSAAMTERRCPTS